VPRKRLPPEEIEKRKAALKRLADTYPEFKTAFEESGAKKGGEIAKGIFLSLSQLSIRQEDINGKNLLTAGYKIEARPDCPMLPAASLLVPFMQLLFEHCHWLSLRHARADLSHVMTYLHNLEFVNNVTGEKDPLVDPEEFRWLTEPKTYKVVEPKKKAKKKKAAKRKR